MSKYEKIGETDELVNTIPTSPVPEEYAWVGDRHDFEISVSEVKDGYFVMTVSPHITCLMEYISAMNAIKNSPDPTDKKISDANPKLRTVDNFKIAESEKDNYVLAYEAIISSINSFNSVFNRISTFAMGREYKVPTYESCLSKIEEGYSNIS